MALTLDGTTGISATGNIYGGNLIVTNSLTAGSFAPTLLSSTGNVTGGNLLTGGIVSATGNVTGNYFIGNGSQLTGVDATQIINGTSNVKVNGSGGNITHTVAGTANVGVWYNAGLSITGDLTVTGNATLSGNILGDRIQNGTTLIDIQTTNGNANITVGGTSNVAVFATTGAYITGLNSVSGNVTGGNLLTGGLISATGTITGTSHLGAVVSVTGNVTGGNILNNGLISSTGNSTAGNYLTAGLISATGNITGNYILGNGSQLTGVDATQIINGTSNARVVSSGGNIAVGIGGTANVAVFATTGAFITGVNSVSGNVTGGNLLTAGIMSAGGNIFAANIIVTGGFYDTGDHLITSTAANANVTLTPTGTGTIIANKDFTNGQANGVGNIGNATGYFNTIFGKATTAQYADLAELYSADAKYEPGTVLVFGGNNEVTVSTVSADPRVAGVVSTNPAHLMNSVLESEYKVAVALQGRVPTSVTGTIRKGDMMVTAGNGVAQASAAPAMGTVIGKALENFDGVSGTIEIVVGRL